MSNCPAMKTLPPPPSAALTAFTTPPSLQLWSCLTSATSTLHEAFPEQCSYREILHPGSRTGKATHRIHDPSQHVVELPHFGHQHSS